MQAVLHRSGLKPHATAFHHFSASRFAADFKCLQSAPMPAGCSLVLCLRPGGATSTDVELLLTEHWLPI